MTTIKAKRAVITLGNIELDVFQLPDGSYRWSAQNITEAINIAHSRCKEICSSKQAQSLIGSKFESKDFSPTKLKGSGSGDIKGYSTEVAFFIWQYEAMKGNTFAQSLVFASGVEVLERRADAAFGILKTEEERNIWFAQRADSRLYRRPFTDKLADENARNGNKTNYGFATLRVYKRANLSEKYKAWKCLPDTKIGFRDTLTAEELASVIRVEDMIVNIMNLRRCTFDDAMEFFKQSFEQ